MIGVGFYCRRTASDVQGFVLGGRNVGSWLTAFAFGTSYFSAVIFVGYAGQFGWKYGLAATWIGLGNALIGSLLAWRILGRRTRLMTQHLQSATMPDFFGKRFFSKPLKVAASVIVFIFLIPYTASLYNGLSRLFSMAFNVDYVWCVLGMAILTGVYVLVGGYMATAVNDFIQGLIMLVGICAVIASVLNGNGGFTAAVESLSQIPSESAPNLSGAFVSFLGPQPIYLLGVVMLTSLGTWGLPQMVGKFYAIRNEAAIRLLVLFFIVVSSAIAIVQARSSVTFIAQLMGISWGALAGAFLAPFLYGLYWKRTTSASVWASFIVGVGVMLGCMYCTFTGKTFISPYFTSPINAGMLAMLLGLVVVPVVSLCSRMSRKEAVEEMFGCYNSTVKVRASDALSEEQQD